MALSAYRLGSKIWIVATERLADPTVPRTLPVGSVVLTVPEARLLAQQIIDAAAKPTSLTTSAPKVIR